MTHPRENHIWLGAFIVLALLVLMNVLLGCAAHHEFAIEANRRGDVVAAYRVSN